MSERSEERSYSFSEKKGVVSWAGRLASINSIELLPISLSFSLRVLLVILDFTLSAVFRGLTGSERRFSSWAHLNFQQHYSYFLSKSNIFSRGLYY